MAELFKHEKLLHKCFQRWSFRRMVDHAIIKLKLMQVSKAETLNFFFSKSSNILITMLENGSKLGYFIGYYTAVPLKMYSRGIWLIKIDFGWPNAEIGWKMGNGWWRSIIHQKDPTVQ